MRRQLPAVVAVMVGIITGACAPTAIPPISSPLPTIADTVTGDPSTSGDLRLIPGVYRYQFTQSAQITGDRAADTLPGKIATRALIHAVVTTEPDSAFAITVSFDSITTSTEGSIPPRGMGQPLSLDSVLKGTFSRLGNTSVVRLPDSLCAYSQFVRIAQELLLLELTHDISVPMKRSFTDTTTQRGCRAGMSIELTTIRELKNLGRSAGEIEIQQRTTVHGTGVLRRDSLAVSGSITSRGKASFTALNRLPSIVQTQSDGTITVQLGSTTTLFRQQSTQEIRLLTSNPN